MRLRSRTPEEELIHVVFAHETVTISHVLHNHVLLEGLTLTKFSTNIGAP